MADKKKQAMQLKKKYGAKCIDNGLRLNPRDFLDMLKWRDELDPHYAKLWLDYTYGGLYNRGVLTERTRLLVAIVSGSVRASSAWDAWAAPPLVWRSRTRPTASRRPAICT